MQDQTPVQTDPIPIVRPEVRHSQTELTPDYESAHVDAPVTPPSGGDFQTTFTLEDGSGDIAVVMGDVSGHSPSLTAQAERLQAALSEHLSGGVSPGEALTAVNAVVEPDEDFEGFATVFVGRLSPESGKLTYASAGHEPGLIADPTQNHTGAIQELTSTGPPVGAAPAEIARFQDEEVTVPEGGTLLLFTDGVSDARSAKHRREWLGLERLKKMLTRFAPLPPQRLVSKMMGRVVAFCKGRLQDDVALLALRRRVVRKKTRLKP